MTMLQPRLRRTACKIAERNPFAGPPNSSLRATFSERPGAAVMMLVKQTLARKMMPKIIHRQ